MQRNLPWSDSSLSLLTILAVPFVEFVGAHFAFRALFGTGMGYGSIVRELPMVPIAIVTFFYLLQEDLPWSLRLNRKALLLHAAALLTILGAAVSLRAHNAAGWFFPFLALALMSWLSGFFLFFPPAELLRRVRYKPQAALLCATASVLILLFEPFNERFWIYLSVPTGYAVENLMRLFGADVWFNPVGCAGLYHPLIHARVYAPCSGLEGVFFFLFASLLVLAFEWNRYTPMQRTIFVLLGIPYMLVLNILRITLFFGFAIWAIGRWGNQRQTTELFVSLFHGHIGWVLYLVGIVIYFLYLFPPRRARQTLPPPV